MYRIARFVVVTGALLHASCGDTWGPAYEYEESMRLDLDGSGTLSVRASVAALALLRGLAVDGGSASGVDPAVLQRFYESPVVSAVRVGRSWRRDGRPFVQVDVAFGDVRALSEVPAFSWSTYAFVRTGDAYEFTQSVAPVRRPLVERLEAFGGRRVAFRLRLPSRILSHNAPSGRVERGNILTWDQTFEARLDGAPLVMTVRLGTTAILRRTLALFGGALVAALVLLGGLVWWIARLGRIAQV